MTTTRTPANPTDFPTDPRGLEPIGPPSCQTLTDGDTQPLRIGPVAARIGSDTVRMLAYNGSVPGPTMRIAQYSEISVPVHNDGDDEATVHWHGLRLDNAYDGVPYETQQPIPIGGDYTYQLRFPDPGLYWYHPHVREDHGLEMGLYGTIVVDPAEPDFWPPADRDLVVTVDDVLIEDGAIAPFSRTGIDHVAMGRFGNVMLTAGRTEWTAAARTGEVVRLYLVNTANTRLFNIAVAGAPMKLIGGDSGRYEHETFVDAVLIAPSERAIVDVLFDTPGRFPLEHRTPERTYTLGTVEVTGEPSRSCPSDFGATRTAPEMTAERHRIQAHRARPPDKTLQFVSLMPPSPGEAEQTATAWTCPMHPDYVATEPGKCPYCGMRLVPADDGAVAAAAVEHDDGHEDHGHDHGTGDGLEWEDLMVEMNRTSTPETVIWRLVDGDTGAVNGAIRWRFAVGDQVKIRLVNDMDQDHPMHHPFHIHGAGRFLVLDRDGVPEANLVWKDTVLLPAPSTVDILLDVTNPGLWMAHCHIAEHNQSGMMFSFEVTDEQDEARS
jgi:FtsP/CotA-like multicopper oxidase with cupredoxin domain